MLVVEVNSGTKVMRDVLSRKQLHEFFSASQTDRILSSMELIKRGEILL